MDNNLTSKSSIQSESAVALPVSSAGFGAASGVDAVRIDHSVSPTYSYTQQLSFYYGEYFKGIMFVLATTMFILVVPAFLARPARLKAMLSKAAKRTIDIFGAMLGLILTLPLWIIIPILIKLDSPGSVFYCQQRVGKNERQRDRRYCQRTDVSDRRNRSRRRTDHNGRLFKMYKFRTMSSEAESKTGPVLATKNDPRKTALGKILRKSRIDEIPQFLNVLFGQMSLVGPRPERPNFVSRYNEKYDNYCDRLNVKPGLTGLAQVTTGYDFSDEDVHEKLRYDLKYINTWSLWLDFKILCRTVVVVLTGRGAC
ncbi:MAG: sugar transferase [candidate division Zixibacteria bacterium]|nr:sugar transferase [candidate division Zixibacteria bacterium]MDH3936362.1 sugar transferase [candidate division Zixibacteria bacterium]MDH4033587.1 sugar transferase [candidate division Zixibacteria bacterium]